MLGRVTSPNTDGEPIDGITCQYGRASEPLETPFYSPLSATAQPIQHVYLVTAAEGFAGMASAKQGSLLAQDDTQDESRSPASRNLTPSPRPG